MGGALGGTLACLANLTVGGAFEPGLWSVVCMAAVFGGATRTPLTSVIFALELTHESNVVLPVLIACIVSDLVSLGLLKHSIMTEKIARRGVRVGHEYELDALAIHTVGQVMTAEVETVPVSLPLRRLMDLFYVHQNRARHQGYPVVGDAGRLVSMVTRSDLPELSERNELGWLVTADVMSTRQTVVAWPEEPLRDAAERMLAAGVGRLPVVLPDQPARLVGILSRSDVFKALASRADDENRRERLLGGPPHEAA
jgi:CBS domain-containing protein